MVSDGQVQISGEYRVFGRYVPAFLRAIQASPIWDDLGSIVEELAMSPTDPSREA